MSTANPTHETRPIKRQRATKAEMVGRNDALIYIIEEIAPCTVRQVFYQASVRGLVDKSEHGYARVQRALVDLRRAGRVPWSWITDSTRWQRKPDSFGSPEEALEDTARFYRKALWREVPVYCEVWIEKDALSGVIYDVTARYDVPLMVARGYASLSFLHGAAEYIGGLDRPAYIYHLGDFDLSGVDAGDKIERTLRELAPEAEIHFERLAVTPEQITRWNLPTRPTKTSDTRSKGFGDISVELDAINPTQLRDLVEEAINRHLPQQQLQVLQEAERSERQLLEAFARRAAA